MKKGVNKVIILGRAGKDPELKYAASGAAIASISIATSDSWKDKTSGEHQEKTEWHNVVFFNKLAEIVGQFIKKGAQIYIEGALRTRKYTDKNGVERYVTEIVASELQMLGSAQAGSQNAAVSKQNTAEFDQFDDDSIPF